MLTALPIPPIGGCPQLSIPSILAAPDPNGGHPTSRNLGMSNSTKCVAQTIAYIIELHSAGLPYEEFVLIFVQHFLHLWVHMRSTRYRTGRLAAMQSQRLMKIE
jgi:hypothetical protein